ncbi:MAG TPA: hypothetical protein VJ508_12720, partial [Saprospiraceae bacterium]|nr:hypothetical protein [Saprospiraceae bacterium]
RQHFPKGYSDTLPKLLKGPLSGLPRVYHIAIELIAHSDGRVDPDNLTAFVQAYQKASPLNLGELWAIPIMLRMALIENLRRLAAQMALNRINNNLADTWADRMIDIAEKDPKSLIVATADMARSNPPMTSSFVAEITRRLLGKGPALTLPLTWIEQRLAENGLTTNGLILEETQKKAAAQVSMSNNISSLRMLNSMDWRAFVENTSLVEKILRRDEVYSRMDFQTRDVYRHKIEAFAKLSNRSEKEVASRVFALTKKRGEDPSLNARLRHVGYYLIDKGLRETEQTLGIRYPWFASLKRSLYGSPLLIYVGSILIISICLSFLLVLRVRAEGLSMGWMIVMAVVALIIMSQLAIAVVNWLSTILVKPDFLPRMNYETAIPPESKTLVVVPTMIGSQAEIEALLETMEVRYLANRQDHLHYALLTDFRDASTEKREGEDTMLAFAQQRVDELNEKYRHEAYDIFFLFHRPRRWNEVDQTWMGHERKRGKLADLMDLLRGSGKEKFQTIVGDISVLQEAKYILTLDTDTQLPRDAAWKIIATMAHPLNQAWFDQKKNRIVEGYGILQPRLATSISPD